jgi:hypothetical protein
MSTLINALQTENKTTENGMVTNSSTLNECVNLFFTIGAMRGQDVGRLLSLFSKAFNEDSQTALRILFWVRDVRGGAGERQVAKDILSYLANTHPNTIKPLIKLIPEYGRWDDLFVFMNTSLEKEAIKTVIKGLEDKNGLAAKWVPRKGMVFNTIRKEMGVTPKELRKLIVGLSKTVEQLMCSQRWEEIEYPKIPSLAMARYTNAFNKNDEIRFTNYKESLVNGETKINAGALYPYDVTKTLVRGDKDLANEQWKALPNFMEGSDEMILPIVDVSGSMGVPAGGNPNLTCMDVAISLGLYISEKNEGPFKDSFITFTSNPNLEVLNGNLYDRFNQLSRADWGMSTNLTAVFSLILNQAIRHNISEAQMPKKILILSDMEFDRCTDGKSNSAIQMIRQKYEEAGYELPNVVFWNIQSRGDNFPVRFDEQGTCLISGFSPSILKSLLGGEDMSPVSIMKKTIDSERYREIVVNH